MERTASRCIFCFSVTIAGGPSNAGSGVLRWPAVRWQPSLLGTQGTGFLDCVCSISITVFSGKHPFCSLSVRSSYAMPLKWGCKQQVQEDLLIFAASSIRIDLTTYLAPWRGGREGVQTHLWPESGRGPRHAAHRRWPLAPRDLRKSGERCLGFVFGARELKLSQWCPSFWRLWATLKQEVLSWATLWIHCYT